MEGLIGGIGLESLDWRDWIGRLDWRLEGLDWEFGEGLVWRFGLGDSVN